MENHIDRSVSNYLIPSRANRVYNRLKRIKQNDSYTVSKGFTSNCESSMSKFQQQHSYLDASKRYLLGYILLK